MKIIFIIFIMLSSGCSYKDEPIKSFNEEFSEARELCNTNYFSHVLDTVEALSYRVDSLEENYEPR